MRDIMTTISTPDLCDQFPDDVRVLAPMFNSYGGVAAFGGEVVTVKCFEDNSLVKDELSKPGAGKVLVVDGGGSLRKALLGDLIAASAVKNGWAGVIIHGCIRDVDAIRAMPIGVQALNSVPLKTEKRGIGDRNVPVAFGGATLNPGEFVYADNNGVIVAHKALL
jgi:regulator of ribonuclease activity A